VAIKETGQRAEADYKEASYRAQNLNRLINEESNKQSQLQKVAGEEMEMSPINQEESEKVDADDDDDESSYYFNRATDSKIIRRQSNKSDRNCDRDKDNDSIDTDQPSEEELIGFACCIS
jgi:hypothetical protein